VVLLKRNIEKKLLSTCRRFLKNKYKVKKAACYISGLDCGYAFDCNPALEFPYSVIEYRQPTADVSFKAACIGGSIYGTVTIGIDDSERLWDVVDADITIPNLCGGLNG